MGAAAPGALDSSLVRRTEPSVLVIGNFDGVHRGHRALLERAAAEAPGLPLVVLTFWPHPVSVIKPGAEPVLLCDLPERIRRLREAGAAEVRVVTFTRELMTTSPADFVEQVLVPMNPAVVVVGENFTFGSKASGTVEMLRELGDGRFRVVAAPLECAEDGERSSSTLVRQALSRGDVEAAAEHLGRPFRFQGLVVMGHQRGRELGFPTANLPVEAGRAVPADGVYAGWLTRLDHEAAEPMPAAISVGTNPTFDDVPDTVVEAHVLDRHDLELYGVEVAVDFVARLRGNVRFDGLDALVAQIAADVDATRVALGIARP